MPMTEPTKVLVVQTAFLGDVVLTLPVVQVLKRHFPAAMIDVLVTPRAAGLLAGHPDINMVIEYDKRGRDAGILGFIRARIAKHGCSFLHFLRPTSRGLTCPQPFH